jgi:N-carbamoyl-L-amino-acid hydrolase
MPRINGERLLGDLRRIAEFGRYQTGVHRPHLSPQDVASRRWLAGRMKEAGLEPVIDGIGNVIGSSRKSGPRLLMGSHTDTQPRGGWLDGVMGVIYGLEVARALAEDPETAQLAVDVASWADEEGHWGGMFGSKSFIGRLAEEDIDNARHREEGTKMRDALKEAGLEGVPRKQIEEGRYRAYLEAHIEQGGLLEATGKRIGVVTAIVGIFQYQLTFTGIQNHAGTTPMPIRKDAGAAMMRLYNEVMEKFPALAGPRSVWTVGKMSIEPGAPAIIPGKAEMVLQFRDADIAVLERFEATLIEIVAAHRARGPCEVTCQRLSRTMPSLMDERLLEAIDAAAEAHAAGQHMRMPSGAGHDAQILALRLPSAMMFVPSIGGISHHFTENTTDADIVLGCQVFADAAAKILRSPLPQRRRGE